MTTPFTRASVSSPHVVSPSPAFTETTPSRTERDAIGRALRLGGPIDVSREGSTVVGVGIGSKTVEHRGPLFEVQGYSGSFITLRTPTATDDYQLVSANRAITEAMASLTGKGVPATVYGTVLGGDFHVTRLESAAVGGIGPQPLATSGQLFKIQRSRDAFITVRTAASTDDYAVRSSDPRITKLVQSLTGTRTPVKLFGSVDRGTFNVTRIELGTIREP